MESHFFFCTGAANAVGCEEAINNMIQENKLQAAGDSGSFYVQINKIGKENCIDNGKINRANCRNSDMTCSTVYQQECSLEDKKTCEETLSRCVNSGYLKIVSGEGMQTEGYCKASDVSG